jgi:hypothetical protein
VNLDARHTPGVMTLRTLAAVAVAALIIVGVAGGAAAANGFSWTDPAGDSGNAPDVTGIAVTNDDAGKITFKLTYGNRPAGLTADDQVQVWLDADESASTGDEDGFDYVLVLDASGTFVKHATTAGLEDTPHSTLSGSADGTTASINRIELANTSAFHFYVVTLTRVDKSRDIAPDATDMVYVYRLAAPRPTQISVAFTPTTPIAGATFTAAVVLVKLDDGSVTLAKSLTCKGTLNGTPIRATPKLLRCVWKLPKSAKGKRLVFTITVATDGSKGTFGPWRFKVR